MWTGTSKASNYCNCPDIRQYGHVSHEQFLSQKISGPAFLCIADMSKDVAAAHQPTYPPEKGGGGGTQLLNNTVATPGGGSVAMLEQEVLYLRQELSTAREQIRKLQEQEKELRDRSVQDLFWECCSECFTYTVVTGRTKLSVTFKRFQEVCWSETRKVELKSVGVCAVLCCAVLCCVCVCVCVGVGVCGCVWVCACVIHHTHTHTHTQCSQVISVRRR